jgi:hypothetical protein
VKKILFASIFMICLSLFGCQDSAKNYPVNFVDRKAVFPIENQVRKANPLMLVVEVAEGGKLSLNKIETGTIDDLALLSEKLKVVFDDREKAGINEREVMIDPRGRINNADLEKLIESLADVKASPIRVIKNNL